MSKSGRYATGLPTGLFRISMAPKVAHYFGSRSS